MIGASRQQQDRGSLVKTEAKTEAGGVETDTEAVKILPRGCLEARQCLEAPHHWKLYNSGTVKLSKSQILLCLAELMHGKTL